MIINVFISVNFGPSIATSTDQVTKVLFKKIVKLKKYNFLRDTAEASPTAFQNPKFGICSQPVA